MFREVFHEFTEHTVYRFLLTIIPLLPSIFGTWKKIFYWWYSVFYVLWLLVLLILKAYFDVKKKKNLEKKSVTEESGREKLMSYATWKAFFENIGYVYLGMLCWIPISYFSLIDKESNPLLKIQKCLFRRCHMIFS